jgi:cathepsin B
MRSAILSLNVAIAGAVCSPCYEKPPACTGSETSVQITGVTGDFCSPLCVQNQCPKGDGSFTAKPSCVLETQGSSKPTQCALICTPGANGACPTGSTCQAIQGEGICTYPSSAADAVAKTTASFVSDAAKPLMDLELIATVNQDATSTWTAGVNDRFVGVSLGNAREMMNARADGIDLLPAVLHSLEEIAATPSSYDPRNDTARAHCTGPILDQGFCGSCWAFGATEAISDRVCMANGNATGGYVGLAPLDLTSCDDGLFSMESGCQGGQLMGAWNYAKKTGLVEETAYPYLKSQGGPVPTCDPNAQPCLPESKFIKTPKCSKPATATKHKISSVYSVPASSLKTELFTNGPVESAFTVYADFPAYKSGVYVHKTGAELGGHAIKIIGYGTEGGQAYWLVQNSWTTTWGNGGYFKIATTGDNGGISDQAVAGKV